MAKFWEPTDEEIMKVESLAARGMQEQQIALCLGIQPETLSRKKSHFEQLDQAIKRGKAKGIAHVTAQLLKNIDNSNVTAQIFYLKTQAGWREEDIRDSNEVLAKANEALNKMQELADKCLKTQNQS